MRDWAYLTTAPNQVVAEMWRDMLIQEGIAAMLQPADAISFIGVSAQPVRVMVAEKKLDAAQKLLAEWEDEGDEAGEETGDDAESQGR